MPHRLGRFLLFMCVTAAGSKVDAQTVLRRTPNLAGSWVGVSGVLHFNFLHRFSISSAPERKVTSAPTFLLGAGLPGSILLGVHYASSSQLSPRYPNEWEFFGRFAPLDQSSGAPLSVSVQLGYNLAAEGVDGEVAVAREQGPVRALAGLRVLAAPGEEDGADVALAGGLVLRLSRYLALAGDVVALTRRDLGEDVAWGAGLSLAIPATPHTLSLHATNANNATLQSSSRGTAETRYGFEFTIPVTLSRYFGRRPTPPAARPAEEEPQASPPATPGRADIVAATVQDFVFQPRRLEIPAGTTVVWTNAGQVIHTVSRDDGELESGPIEPGEQHRMTFRNAGTFSFHCTPHPFMTGVVVVR